MGRAIVAPPRSGRPAAVLVGLREHGFLVARCLGREGARVLVLDDLPPDHLSASRYLERVEVHDLADEQAVLDTLRRLEPSLPNGAVLVATRDQAVILLSRLRDRLPGSYRLALPPHDVVMALLDKRGIRDRAEAAGVPIPGTAELLAEDSPRRIAERLRPPYLAKPFLRDGSPRQGMDYTVHRIATAAELARFHARLPPGAGVLVQEWIPGPDSGLHFVLYYFGSDSRPTAWFTGRKLRQFRPHTGSACHAEPFSDPVALELGNRFFDGLGYRGFGAIEFKVHAETGVRYLIEPTVGRTEHLFALAAANGVNLPYIGYLDMIGAPRPRGGSARGR